MNSPFEDYCAMLERHPWPFPVRDEHGRIVQPQDTHHSSPAGPRTTRTPRSTYPDDMEEAPF